MEENCNNPVQRHLIERFGIQPVKVADGLVDQRSSDQVDGRPGGFLCDVTSVKFVRAGKVGVDGGGA